MSCVPSNPPDRGNAVDTATRGIDDPFPRRCIEVLGSFMATIDLDPDAGDPIVFVHGNPTHAYLWRNVIPHVRGRGRILALDLIGMGASGKPDGDYRFADHARHFGAWLDALSLDRIVFVAHDWGAALALDWWTRHPARVRAIALSEAVLAPVRSWEDFPKGGRATFQALRTPEVGERMILDANHFIEQSLPRSILRGLDPVELEAYRAPFQTREQRRPMLTWPREMPIAGEPADVVAIVQHSLDMLARSNVPKLLLTVEPGALVRSGLIAWCRNHLPALEVAALGAGIHYPQEDQPEAFGRALSGWLDRLGRNDGAWPSDRA